MLLYFYFLLNEVIFFSILRVRSSPTMFSNLDKENCFRPKGETKTGFSHCGVGSRPISPLYLMELLNTIPFCRVKLSLRSQRITLLSSSTYPFVCGYSTKVKCCFIYMYLRNFLIALLNNWFSLSIIIT